MRTSVRNRWLLAGLWISGALLGFSRVTPALATDLAIIVNEGNDVATINDDRLKNLYLKTDHYWGSDLPVTPVHRNEGSKAYQLFLSRVTGQSPSEALSYWIGRKQVDGATPPMQIADDHLVIHLVSKMKGAIGYVESTALSDPPPPGIRVIRTIKE
jgi:ABC-type phosphate transport system substrate-binding protein